MLDRLHAILAGGAAAFAFLWLNALADPPRTTKAATHTVQETGRTTTSETVRRPCPPCAPCRRRHDLGTAAAQPFNPTEARLEAALEELDILRRQVERGDEVVCKMTVTDPGKTETWNESESKPGCATRWAYGSIPVTGGVWGADYNAALGERLVLGGAGWINPSRNEWGVNARIGLAVGE